MEKDYMIDEEFFEVLIPPTEYANDTELELETLLRLDWQLHDTETSSYSGTWAETYLEPTGRWVKKVYSDGFVDFYELA